MHERYSEKCTLGVWNDSPYAGCLYWDVVPLCIVILLLLGLVSLVSFQGLTSIYWTIDSWVNIISGDMSNCPDDVLVVIFFQHYHSQSVFFCFSSFGQLSLRCPLLWHAWHLTHSQNLCPDDLHLWHKTSFRHSWWLWLSSRQLLHLSRTFSQGNCVELTIWALTSCPGSRILGRQLRNPWWSMFIFHVLLFIFVVRCYGVCTRHILPHTLARVNSWVPSWK